MTKPKRAKPREVWLVEWLQWDNGERLNLSRIYDNPDSAESFIERKSEILRHGCQNMRVTHLRTVTPSKRKVSEK